MLNNYVAPAKAKYKHPIWPLLYQLGQHIQYSKDCYGSLNKPPRYSWSFTDPAMRAHCPALQNL